jgi:hypothetical protein
MNIYRITIRHGVPHRYHVEDVRAASLKEAMRLAAERCPDAIGSTGDLLEIRKQVEPADRAQVPG